MAYKRRRRAKAGSCPECGGLVKEQADGSGICSKCGAQLVQIPESLRPRDILVILAVMTVIGIVLGWSSSGHTTVRGWY